MRPADNVTRAISQFEVKAPARLDRRVREDVCRAFNDLALGPSAAARRPGWRVIVSSRIVQLAAAAVIVVVLLLGLHMWDLLGTQAYAVEDTVAALRKIETAHAFCTDWQGRRFEMWIQPNPATGRNDFISLVEPERNSIAVSTPRVSYIYDTRQNSVRFIRGQVITSSLNLASIVESLADGTDKKDDSVVITRKTTDRYGDVIALHYTGAVYEGEAWIDPKTKLLLSLTIMRCSNPGEVVKSFDELRYNESIPEQLLHFQCPDDAEIKPERWGDFDNPKYGLDVEGLSEQQACVKILIELFGAVNAVDLDRLRKLIPVAGEWGDPELVAAVQQVAGKSWDDRVSGIASYEIGASYHDKACPLGVLVPCVLTDHNGRRFEITFIVRLRSLDGRRTGVVVYTWGQAKLLEE